MNEANPDGTDTPGIPARLGLPVACLAMALVAVAARYALLVFHAVRFPYELDYGEGIVWQQMNMIVAGHGYAPLAPYPAIVFHYPPVFHLLSAAMSATGLDELAAGRLVAVACTLIGTAFAGLIVAGFARAPREQGPMRLGGAVTALSLLGTLPVLIWSVVMRVDMPFVALSFAGLWLGIRVLRHPAAVHGAALCFIGAIFTKQTAIAAPLAVFAVLLAVRTRTALIGIATGLTGALAALAVVTALTHGEFLHHIVFYNMNRFSWRAGLDAVTTAGMHLGLVLAAAVAFVPRLRAMARAARARGGWLAQWRADPDDAALAMVLIYFAIATVMLAMMFKSGSAVNYVLEWIVLVAIGAGVAVGDFIGWAADTAAGRKRWLAAAPWLVAAQALVSYTMIADDYPKRAAQWHDFDKLSAVMRAAPGPIISDDMVLLLRSGKPVAIEPSIFAELSEKHVLDDRPVLGMLALRRFSMLLTEGWPGDPVFDSRYSPAMAWAIETAYPQQIRLSNFYIVRLPAGPLPDWAKPLKTP